MLTAAAVAKLKPSDKRREIPDAGAPGLRLVIHPTGRKVWIARFRRPGGKAGNLTLGPLDTSGSEEHAPVLGHPLTLAGARVLANEISRQRTREIDVIALRGAERQRKRATLVESSANTFAIGAQDFIDRHVVRKTGKKPRRWMENARMLGLDYSKGEPPTVIKGGLADRWRDKPVQDISDDDLYLLIEESRRHRVPGMSKKNKAASDSRGRHMAAVLSSLFKWLKAHRRIKTNPALEMTKPPPSRARQRVLTDAEVRELWQVCDAIGAQPGQNAQPPWGAFIKLLLLTGARRNEIARLEDSELGDGLITLPGARTKNGLPHQIPLSPLAVEILSGVQRFPNCKYVFSTNGRSPISGFSKLKKSIDKLIAKRRTEDGVPEPMPPFVLHDARRTASTGMNDIGVLPHIVEAILNHISGQAKRGVAGTYNLSLYSAEKREALQKWSDHVAGIAR
jgi:integrase